MDGVDVVFHLAAIPRVQQSIKFPAETHLANVDGTLNMLMGARNHQVKRFVFASSSSVYGNQDGLPFEETMTPNPLTPYALHKLMGEQYCGLFYNLWGLETISLRFFNVFGPRMNPDGDYANLIPKFIKLMSQDKIPTINGDGEQTRDFTFVSDVVEAIMLSAKSDVSGEIFNVGQGKNISVNEVARTLNRIMGKNIQPIHGPAVVESRSTLASLSKIRTLGWQPHIEFEDGLQTML